MQNESKKKLRVTVDIDESLKKSIQEMAGAKNWSFSYMSYVLLQQAVKERMRKKQDKPKLSHEKDII